MFKVNYHDVDGTPRAKLFLNEEKADSFANMLGYEHKPMIEVIDWDYSQEALDYDLTPAIKAIYEVVKNKGVSEDFVDVEHWAFDFGAGHLPWEPSLTADVAGRLIYENEALLERFEEVTGFDLKADLQEVIDNN